MKPKMRMPYACDLNTELTRFSKFKLLRLKLIFNRYFQCHNFVHLCGPSGNFKFFPTKIFILTQSFAFLIILELIEKLLVEIFHRDIRLKIECELFDWRGVARIFCF